MSGEFGLRLTLGALLLSGLRSNLPLPPGPKPWPLLGNITDLPPEGQIPWRHWLKHKSLYGPISSVTVLGQTLIIIHDREAASELMEKRAVKYSARPTGTFANEMCGFDMFLVSQQPGPRFQSFRRLAQTHIGTSKALERFSGLMDVEVGRLLVNLVDGKMLREPDGLEHALHMSTSAIVLRILFNYSIDYHYHQEHDNNGDPLTRLNDQVMASFSEASLPGRWLVDMIPWVKHVPKWFPGTGFKDYAGAALLNNRASAEVPFRFVKQTAATRPGPSMVGDLLRARDAGSDVSEHDIKYSATSLHAGGVETTTQMLQIFFLAMSMYPEVQVRAQQEVDELLRTSGADGGEKKRLPGLQDRSKLPYVSSLVKEVLRWFPVAPLGVPHLADAEDEYRGYRIPKNAILLPAVHWFSRDPDVYHDPETFKPERYLAPHSEPDPSSFVFGFGRRICPGKRLADEGIFLVIAKALAVLDVSKALDEEGKEIEPVFGHQSSGIVAHALPFSVSIAPRSEAHAELVRELAVEHPLGQGDSKSVESLLNDFLQGV
ncbi:putative cytochrome P450 oxidoreductase [Cryphonectria parasitica EP155]|uniref:Cytochrome P450 oxidoreductase n=1 Tax=Cryphonectria parasitica (strain ATCC 38755 / EP155) TaxID=660469 RepID=A0A9P4Y6G8_CRYP1|nr:putative cytochrome P450 oxidoreductase [Cryphonectria parasitica EP155]KAF3767438.1 putative cytochrome P450 oxidoreductase [Cryphonectria parasitica EP155]